MPKFEIHYIVKKTHLVFAPTGAEAVAIAKETLPITDGPTAQIVQCLPEGAVSEFAIDRPGVKTVG